ncbi:hypothetical protein K439DRAFT_1612017 [Ramaria rubella]|nr:hypothetical protein K439DRAFT_1612017 [Ramaria rubella]
MSSTFANYSSPDLNTAFSEEFFKTLTFQEVRALILPQILPWPSLHGWMWMAAPAEMTFKSLLEMADLVPHIADLQDILKHMEGVYDKGMRGVALTLYTLIGVKIVHAHFSLVSCCLGSVRRLLTRPENSFDSTCL